MISLHSCEDANIHFDCNLKNTIETNHSSSSSPSSSSPSSFFWWWCVCVLALCQVSRCGQVVETAGSLRWKEPNHPPPPPSSPSLSSPFPSSPSLPPFSPATLSTNPLGILWNRGRGDAWRCFGTCGRFVGGFYVLGEGGEGGLAFNPLRILKRRWQGGGGCLAIL